MITPEDIREAEDATAGMRGQDRVRAILNLLRERPDQRSVHPIVSTAALAAARRRDCSHCAAKAGQPCANVGTAQPLRDAAVHPVRRGDVAVSAALGVPLAVPVTSDGLQKVG